jgi:LCP family protein required for cell wall assembly
MTSRTTTDAGQGLPGRRSARSVLLRRPRHPVRVALAALVVLVLAVLGDVALITSRIDHLDVALAGSPEDQDGTTWVLLGLDSRTDLPTGADVTDFGTAADVPGTRADVVVVVHQGDHGTTVLSVPRDVVVRAPEGPDRLALTWLAGPANTVGALCSLGIPTDHLVTVDLAGFAGLVDAAGGLDVDVPEPVRDVPAGLELPTAGRQHVDGVTALAMVRSRHPEHLADGGWVPATVDPNGRASAAGTVLSALAAQVRGSLLRPVRLQRTAWAASGAVQVDPDTSMTELASLARADLGSIQVLPVGEPLAPAIARLPIRATSDAVRAAGMSCAD